MSSANAEVKRRLLGLAGPFGGITGSLTVITDAVGVGIAMTTPTPGDNETAMPHAFLSCGFLTVGVAQFFFDPFV
jgi:hypothetical protein